MRVEKNITMVVIAVILMFGCNDKSEFDNPVPGDQEPMILSVATSSVWKIELDKAEGEGKVICDGGSQVTARGFVWSLEPKPTLADNSSVDGDGTGQFKSLVTDLQPDQTYYARAYATNSLGTAYGREEVFRTRLGAVADIDGNVYYTLAIGKQIWMAENLRVTRYANGDPIPTGLGAYEWQNANYGAYAIYPHNPTNVDSDAEVVEAYGLLYNWFVAGDPRKICPPEWRVPDNTDWESLIGRLGGETRAGGPLKSKRTVPLPAPSWNFPNEATDESGWSGMPGGRRLWNGDWSGIGSHGHWLSSTERDILHNYSRIISHANTQIFLNYSYKQNANSIRCVRDAEDK